ncbi:MAG: DNA alkylation repair protein [bacterium]|nr:DNA alkylation repair protein [bacterium]
MTSYVAVQRAIRMVADPERAAVSRRFFKTNPGEYGAGDRFLGLTVPQQRTIAKRFPDLPRADAQRLLASAVHEDRLVALFILIAQFTRGDRAVRRDIFRLYLAQTAQVNNWDLVDASAYQIVGAYLRDHPRGVLLRLARSRHLWDRRIAIVSTMAFIARGEFDDTLAIARVLLRDEHDLIRKATGWMLREVGKRSRSTLEGFLDAHAHAMPRTMLRSAIERLPECTRRAYRSQRAPA